jgi:hypothetical protein
VSTNDVIASDDSVSTKDVIASDESVSIKDVIASDESGSTKDVIASDDSGSTKDVIASDDYILRLYHGVIWFSMNDILHEILISLVTISCIMLANFVLEMFRRYLEIVDKGIG